MTVTLAKRDVLITARDVVSDLVRYSRSQLAKAALPAGIAVRDSRVADFEADLAEFFLASASRVLGTVRKALPFDWDPIEDVDWTVEDDELETVLARWYATLGDDAFAAVSEQLAVELRFDVGDRNVTAVLDQVAVQVKGIGDESRRVIRSATELAVDRGYSIEQLVGGVDGDRFPGLRGLFEAWSANRATTVALTETANAYNAASLAGYASSGLVETVNVYDGPDCGWAGHNSPDLANGSVRTLEEARRQPISHPRCQRAFGAVVVR